MSQSAKQFKAANIGQGQPGGRKRGTRDFTEPQGPPPRNQKAKEGEEDWRSVPVAGNASTSWWEQHTHAMGDDVEVEHASDLDDWSRLLSAQAAGTEYSVLGYLLVSPPPLFSFIRDS